MNEFPISSITLHADSLNLFEKCYLRAFCLLMMSKIRLFSGFFINAWKSSISGPDSIHHTIADLVDSLCALQHLRHPSHRRCSAHGFSVWQYWRMHALFSLL